MKIMHPYFITLFLSLIIPGFLSAQSITTKTYQNGHIRVHEPEIVSDLLTNHADFIDEIETIDGYRIQIASVKDYRQINTLKSNCHSRLPKYKVYTTYKAPYYKIRLGDYINYLDAYRAYQEILKKIPVAMIVKDKIKIEELE